MYFSTIAKKCAAGEMKYKQKTLRLKENSVTYSIGEVNIFRDHVSVNVPYQRFLSGLIPSFTGFPTGKIS